MTGVMGGEVKSGGYLVLGLDDVAHERGGDLEEALVIGVPVHIVFDGGELEWDRPDEFVLHPHTYRHYCVT